MRAWPSPEVAQILHCNRKSAKFSTIKDRICTFLTNEINTSFEYGSIIGDTQFMFVVNDFFPPPFMDITDNVVITRNNHVIIQIDDEYAWNSDETVEWTKQLKDADKHGYSIIRIHSKDILHERFDWRARLIRYSRQPMFNPHPVIYLPNRPDKQIIHKNKNNVQ